MLSSAHLALGLIIGKLTGDYPTAIISSTAIDLDHIWPQAKNKAFSSFKNFWQATTDEGDTSRTFFHNFFFLFFVAGIIALFSWITALIFALGCLGHFLLDALDNSDFYPLWPIKKWNTKGFIGYYSKFEFWLTIGLYLIFFSLFLFK
jgi:membrane-bound metal-dependent hydrolase YbcI (DUF457 family)